MVSLSPAGPFKQVSVGRWGGFCAIKNDNTIGCSEGNSTSCFGNKFSDLNESQVGIAQISVGNYLMSPHDCAIKTDGTVACWNDIEASWETSIPPGPYKQVSTKGNHTCAVKTDGTLVCWGYYYDFLAGNENGTIPVEPPPSGSSFVQVSTGFYHACALRSDGTITCWHHNGENYQDFGQTVVPAGTYTQVGAGFNHTCALDDKGAIHCWGDNASGHTDVPDGTYTQLHANTNTSCGLREDGAIVCWGTYFSSTSELSGPYVDFDASDGTLCALSSNGSITCFSENADSEVTKSLILPGNL